MKKQCTPLALWLCGLFFSLSAAGQAAGPTVLAPGGTSDRGARISLDWTLGELAVRTLSTSDGLVTEGFHQPLLYMEEVVAAPAKKLDGSFRLTAAPNPVRSVLSIRIDSELEGKAVIDLWDSLGRHLQRATASLSGETLDWDLSTLPPAVYTLSFRTETGEPLQSLRVTKVD